VKEQIFKQYIKTQSTEKNNATHSFGTKKPKIFKEISILSKLRNSADSAM
jgi:hypothetical protein